MRGLGSGARKKPANLLPPTVARWQRHKAKIAPGLVGEKISGQSEFRHIIQKRGRILWHFDVEIKAGGVAFVDENGPIETKPSQAGEGPHGGALWRFKFTTSGPTRITMTTNGVVYILKAIGG